MQTGEGWYQHQTTIQGSFGRLIAQLYGNADEMNANARLIVAAPEMRDLLNELVEIEGRKPGTQEWAAKVLAILEQL